MACHAWALILGAARGCQRKDKRVMNAERIAYFGKEESDWNDLWIRQLVLNEAAILNSG